MKIEVHEVGMLQVNGYLVWDEATLQALIIDPGDDADRVIDAVRDAGVTPHGILLTHAHVDHIRGVPEVAQAFAVPVMLHPADEPLYSSPANELQPWVPAATGLPAPATVANDLPGLEFRMIHTPGHTRGGCCYYFAGANVLFSGDTLFRHSIGRTDLPGGDTETLLNSIRAELFALPETTRVYPGHGPTTTIADEIQWNPYLKGLA